MNVDYSRICHMTIFQLYSVLLTLDLGKHRLIRCYFHLRLRLSISAD